MASFSRTVGFFPPRSLGHLFSRSRPRGNVGDKSDQILAGYCHTLSVTSISRRQLFTVDGRVCPLVVCEGTFQFHED